MSTNLSVLGLGKMGFALAATLQKKDQVTVWNRTAGKAASLVAMGAIQASSAAEAVSTGDIIVLCVGNYKDSHAILSDCGDLKGKTLIQLTTGSATDAKTMQDWAIGKGALYLDGVILAFPSGIGLKDSQIICAGSEDAWTTAEQILKSLGGASQYVGVNLNAPIALESAMIGPTLMATMGIIQGAYTLEQAGLDVGIYAELLSGMGPFLTENLKRQAKAIAANEFSDTEAALGTWAAALTHNSDVRGTATDFDFLEPISNLLNKAVEAGYGDEEISAAIKILRQTSE